MVKWGFYIYDKYIQKAVESTQVRLKIKEHYLKV